MPLPRTGGWRSDAVAVGAASALID